MSRLGRTWSVSLTGVQGEVIEVEATIESGLPRVTLVGLPDAAVSEARDRCRAAVVNSDQDWPNRKLTIGLYPANKPKTGTMHDLAIAMAVLCADGEVPASGIDRAVLLGELSLDGRVRPLPGILPATMAAADAGFATVMVPSANAGEASVVEGVQVCGVRSLRHAVALLKGLPVPADKEVPYRPVASSAWATGRRVDDLDLSEVLGQAEARHSLEVAAAGGHHLFLEGPPGAGKTMLAERLPGLLPDLPLADALEVSAIHSVAGILDSGAPLSRRPPFLDPHHTASPTSIVGGGGRVLRPGAMSLAHRGVLFLDEAPEFSVRTLEAMRQPLESGEVTICRAESSTSFPARFQLVLAANPCPCGFDWGRRPRCECPPAARLRYRSRISGPVRDRIDIYRSVNPPSRQHLRDDLAHVESTQVVAARVLAARERQRFRYRGTRWARNSDVPGSQLRRSWPVRNAAARTLDDRLADGRISARGADRVLRLSWTLADLGGRASPDDVDVEMAWALRTSDPLPAQGDNGQVGRPGSSAAR
uniref:MG(2+) CHELATASE FAMILY PROTEIN / ComM-related protein n=1 Tax=uncultured Nocardioidaceae bacterium TaxID=253824 RepID=A0A6J4MM13_9ACTN|nr:MAG: MG(2+) CHELATASE FAMILY PROTEIN / ComM-related protein [uncultured Nocardioidaceae bacterium]